MTVRGENIRGNTKEKNIRKLFAFLSDINNQWPIRRRYSQDILGYSQENSIYRSLSPSEISKIENDALESIKAQSARQRKEIYNSLYLSGKGGDVGACREFLDRTEGKVPTNINANVSGDLTIEIIKFTDQEKE